MPGTEGSPLVPQTVLTFVARLSMTMKAQRLYPAGSDIPHRNAAQAREAFHYAILGEPYLELGVARSGLMYGEARILPHSESFAAFATEFYRRNLAAVRFAPEVTPEELLAFLSIIIQPAEEVAAQGGVTKRISELGIVHVTVSEVSTRVIETSAPEGVFDDTEEDDESLLQVIERTLEDPSNDRARDAQVLIRVMGHRRVVADYLKRARSDSPTLSTETLRRRIAAMLRGIRRVDPGERTLALEAIADAIKGLSPIDRGRLYRDALLSSARYDDAVEQLINILGRAEVMEALLAQTDRIAEEMEGLAHVLRRLAGMVEGSSAGALKLVLSEFGSLGPEDPFIAGVIEAAQRPTIKSFRDIRTSAAWSKAPILGSLDDTSGAEPIVAPELLAQLEREAKRGTSDGEIVVTLASAAAIETRPKQFEALIEHVTNSVGYLVEAGETDLAADVAQVLKRAMADPATSAEHRQRMQRVLGGIASADSLEKVAATLRRRRTDSPEYASCKRLLDVLGESAIDPLLAILGEEEDMSARKSLIDLISSNAESYIQELGSRLGDKRWYLVRNVVVILAATRSPDVLPLLQRTLRHPDARVRRETIRSLASIRTVASDAMLATGLEDEDLQAVQITARYLGSIKSRSAVPALEQLARGLGRGNREVPARIDAIAALGKIGSPTSLPILREIAGRRGLFGGGRDREVRAAAEEALKAIEDGAGGTEVPR